MIRFSTVRAALQAYVDKDRAAIERLVADDYRFTSPLDNALDRAAYLRICWPNSRAMKRFEVVHAVQQGEQAVVIYEAETTAGKRFRNCEAHIVRGGRLISTEVYFGWNVPHAVPKGEHRDP
jgi:ketosteroid isomerase-like protein